MLAVARSTSYRTAVYLFYSVATLIAEPPGSEYITGRSIAREVDWGQLYCLGSGRVKAEVLTLWWVRRLVPQLSLRIGTRIFRDLEKKHLLLGLAK